MASCIRPLFLLATLLGFATGCAHKPDATRPAPASRVAATEETLGGVTPPGRVTAPGTPFARAHDATGFAPVLVVTTQVSHADLFIHRLDNRPPSYASVRRIHRGQEVFILPIALDFARAVSDGRTDLTYTLEIRRPDGAPDGSPVRAVLWQERAAALGQALYPATSVVFHAEPDDPAGAYVVTARVTDHLAGETRELVHTLLLDDAPVAVLPSDFDAKTWFNTYYLSPTPEYALAALPRLFLGLPADQRAAARPPLLGFYDQVLRDNVWLLPAFCARLAVAKPDEAYALSLVLGHHLRAAAACPVGVDPATWERLADFRTYAWPSDPERPLALASQIDTLWGRFYASGLYAPIERMLYSLSSHADLGATDQWQKRRADAGLDVDLSPASLAAAADPAVEITADTPPPDVLRDIVLRNAIWSLRGNSREHPLVRGYLDWTLRLGDMPDAEKILLARILRPEPAAPTALAR